MKNFLPLINTHPRNLDFQKRIFREKQKNRIFRGNTVFISNYQNIEQKQKKEKRKI